MMRKFTCACMLLAAACQAPPSVVVTIEDPGGEAQDADEVAISILSDPETEQVRALAGRTFPLSFVLVGEAKQRDTVRVWARRAQTRFAFGEASVRFADRGVGAATIVLSRSCETAADCDDGLFCSGLEQCVAGQCRPGTDPCEVGAAQCVQTRCDETQQSCVFEVVAGLDDNNPCTDDLCTDLGPRHSASAAGQLCLAPQLAEQLGVCEAGYCEASRCGDGYIDPRVPERCDAGRELLACRACQITLQRLSLSAQGGDLNADSQVEYVSENGQWLVFRTAADAEAAGLGSRRFDFPGWYFADSDRVLLHLPTLATVNLGRIPVLGVTDSGLVLGFGQEQMLMLIGPIGQPTTLLRPSGYDRVAAAAISSDGSRVVARLQSSANRSSLVYVWGVDRQPILAPQVNDGYGYALTPDGRYLATPNARHDLDTGEVVNIEFGSSSLAPSPEGRVFISADGARIVYETLPLQGSYRVAIVEVGGEPRLLSKMRPCGVAWDQDVVVGIGPNGYARLDLRTDTVEPVGFGPSGEPLYVYGGQRPAECGAPVDGRYLVMTSNAAVPLVNDDNDSDDVFYLPLLP